MKHCSSLFLPEIIFCREVYVSSTDSSSSDVVILLNIVSTVIIIIIIAWTHPFVALDVRLLALEDSHCLMVSPYLVKGIQM
jgi:hypothetical protein